MVRGNRENEYEKKERVGGKTKEQKEFKRIRDGIPIKQINVMLYCTGFHMHSRKQLNN